MPSLLARLWELVGATGGGVALAFIVGIALGLLALTLLFAGAAVLVLERFARAARRPGVVAAAGVLWALALTALAIGAASPERLPAERAELTALLLRTAAGGIVATAVAVGLVWLAVRRLRPARLGAGVVSALALGWTLLAAGGVRPEAAAAGAGVLALAGLGGALRRRRRGGRGSARPFALLAALLAIGPALAWLSPTPPPGAAPAGAALLALVASLVVLGLVPLAAAGFLEARGSAEWFIASRYLFARRRQAVISVITAICVAGVAAGVWLIITVLSVMNGFERTWREEIIGNRAHFSVFSGLGAFSDYEQTVDRVLRVPGVLAASPYLDAEGMVRGEGGQIVGVRVRGIDPRRVGEVTELREDLIAGSLEALEPELAPREAPADVDPGIVVGSALGNALGLEVGAPLLLVSPFGGPPTPLGPAPRLARFRVVGIFQSSFFQYDEVFTYVSLPAAQAFRRTGDVVDGIEVSTRDFYRSRRIADEVEAALGFPFYARDWKEFFPAFFQALKTERIMMFVLLTMIMVVAAFAIVVTLVMMIMEKSSDIAILKAMGADDATVERVFAIEGALIGLLGTGLGVVAGIVVTSRLDWIQRQVEAVTGIDTLPQSVYQFSTLPWQFDAAQIAAVVAIAMVLALGATLLPSRQGARLDPAEALRYE